MKYHPALCVHIPECNSPSLHTMSICQMDGWIANEWSSILLWVGTSDKGMKQIYFLRLGDLTMFCPFPISTNSDKLVALLKLKALSFFIHTVTAFLSTRSRSLLVAICLTGKSTPAPHSPSKASPGGPHCRKKSLRFGLQSVWGERVRFANPMKQNVKCYA